MKMRILSTLLAVLFMGIGPVRGQKPPDKPFFPVKGDVDLSSNFCEPRPGHFHGGIDIRTGGVEGREVFAPADGYIWRLKYSFIGYGKGLYLKDLHGNIYVFGHLSALAERFEKIVRDYQYKNQIYSFDLFFEPDSLPVKKGELVAFSGQTGYGAPHIHFEVRNKNNLPLNPLTNGFDLPDKYRPRLEGLGLIYLDSSSLFPDGERRIYPTLVFDKIRKQYTSEKPVVVRGAFGIMVKVVDRLRENGPRLNIHKAELYIDDQLYYEAVYDRYDYAQTGQVDLCFDYPLLVRDNEFWHLLFIPEGGNFEGARSPRASGGIYGVDLDNSHGLHRARAEFSDAVGNKAVLNFQFIWLPSGNIYRTVWFNDSTCYFEKDRDDANLDIRRVTFWELPPQGPWRTLDSSRVSIMPNGDYRLLIPGYKERPRAIKCRLRGESGWSSDDALSILDDRPLTRAELNYDLQAGGLKLEATANRRAASPPMVEIQYEDGFVSRRVMELTDADNFSLFIKADKIKSKITRVRLLDALTQDVLQILSPDIHYAGAQSPGTFAIARENLNIDFTGKDFYAPVYLEIKTEEQGFPDKSSLVGRVYSVGPETVPLADGLNVRIESLRGNDPQVGLYRLNSKGKWTWMEPQRDSGGITTRSRLVGTFALLEDLEPPLIKNIQPGQGATISKTMPEISCRVNDNLSGVDFDGSMTITLDGRWLIPEYDPETEILKTLPPEKLAPGKHDLEIMVTDRCGNNRKTQISFTVGAGINKKK